MPIKTKDGWKSRKQISAQEKAWKKARATLMLKLGPAVDDASMLDAKAEALFKEFDLDGNGKIDAAEVKQTFSKAGIELKTSEVAAMVKEADEDGDNLIDLDEFKDLLKEEIKRFKAVSSFCVIA